MSSGDLIIRALEFYTSYDNQWEKEWSAADIA